VIDGSGPDGDREASLAAADHRSRTGAIVEAAQDGEGRPAPSASWRIPLGAKKGSTFRVDGFAGSQRRGWWHLGGSPSASSPAPALVVTARGRFGVGISHTLGSDWYSGTYWRSSICSHARSWWDLMRQQQSSQAGLGRGSGDGRLLDAGSSASGWARGQESRPEAMSDNGSQMKAKTMREFFRDGESTRCSRDPHHS
jgi:hypothetical protein